MIFIEFTFESDVAFVFALSHCQRAFNISLHWDETTLSAKGIGEILFWNFFFRGHQSFLWGHWYPYFVLLVMLALGFKTRVDLLNCLRTFAQRIPQIHFWSATCWPLGGQHGRRTVSIHVLAMNFNTVWLSLRIDSVTCSSGSKGNAPPAPPPVAKSYVAPLLQGILDLPLIDPEGSFCHLLEITAAPNGYFFLTIHCRCCVFSRPEGEAKYCKNTAGNGCHLPQPPVQMFYLPHVVPTYTALFNTIQLLKFRFFLSPDVSRDIIWANCADGAENWGIRQVNRTKLSDWN